MYRELGSVVAWSRSGTSILPGRRPTPSMSTTQMAIEYLLVYCTSHGLTTIGEPPLSKTYQPVGDSLVQTSRARGPWRETMESKDAMPVWIMFIFLALATAKYIVSFMVSGSSYTYITLRSLLVTLGLVCIQCHFNRRHGCILQDQDNSCGKRSEA